MLAKLTLHDPADEPADLPRTAAKASKRANTKSTRKAKATAQETPTSKPKPYRLVLATLGKVPTSEEFENLHQVALRLQREIYTNPPEDVRFFLTVGQAVELGAKDTVLVLSHGDTSVDIRLPSLAADPAVVSATGMVLSDIDASSTDDTTASEDAGDDFFFA